MQSGTKADGLKCDAGAKKLNVISMYARLECGSMLEYFLAGRKSWVGLSYGPHRPRLSMSGRARGSCTMDCDNPFITQA